MTLRTTRVSALLLLAAAACGAHAPPAVDAAYVAPPEPAGAPRNALTPDETRQGWKLLFNGYNTDGWLGWRMDSVPPGWTVAGGTLTHSAPTVDIVSAAQYRNFDLRFDWKTTPGGHGGVFYRADEKSDALWKSAPEFELLGDSLQGDRRTPYYGAGAVTGIYLDRSGVLEPAGRWNHAEIIVKGRRVEHRLNGVKVLDYVLESPDWVDRVRRSDFAKWPEYGRALSGHIGLAGSGSGIEYANVMVRELP